MAELGVSVLIKAVDRITAPVRAISKSTTGLQSQLSKTQKKLSGLDSKARKIEGFRAFRAKVKDTETQLEAARAETKRIAQEIAKTDKPTKALTKSFEQAKHKAAQLKEAHKKEAIQLERVRRGMKDAGISTRNLSEESRNLKREIDAANRSLNKQAALQKKLSAVAEPARKVASNLGKVTREAGALGIKLTALGGGAAWAFKSQFIDTATEFERFKTILETVVGSSAKESKSMDWVSNFAAKTPYELDQVMDSFVKLRSYGLDPTQGLLKTLGDTSSAMGKDIGQAVEAIADAVTGENERLKEFGITGSKSGGTITYEFTNKAGEQQQVSVDANNRKEIQATLEGIFNEKYAGAMDKQSKTWNGMISNMADQWTRFKIMIMENGVFDFLKEKLSSLLDKINIMAENGTLQQYAKDLAGNLMKGLKAAYSFGVGVVNAGKAVVSAFEKIANAVGGAENLMIGIAALIGGKLIFAIGSLASSVFSLANKAMLAFTGQTIKANAVLTANKVKTVAATVANQGFSATLLRSRTAMAGMATSGISKLTTGISGLASFVIRVIPAIWSFNAALLANPIVLIAAAIIAAIGLIAAVIYKYWEPIKAFVGGIFDGFMAAIEPIKVSISPLGEALAPVGRAFSLISDGVGWVIDKLFNLFAPVEMTKEQMAGIASTGQKFGSILGAAFNTLLTPIRLVIDAIDWVLGKIGDVVNAGKAVANVVGNTVGAVTDTVSGAVNSVTEGASQAWNSVTNFFDFGDDETKQEPASKKIVRQAKQASNVIPFPDKSSLGAPSLSQNQAAYKPLKMGGNTVSVQNSSNITVVQQPGEDSTKLARRIAQEEVRAWERQNQAKQRAALYDVS